MSAERKLKLHHLSKDITIHISTRTLKLYKSFLFNFILSFWLIFSILSVYFLTPSPSNYSWWQSFCIITMTEYGIIIIFCLFSYLRKNHIILGQNFYKKDFEIKWMMVTLMENSYKLIQSAGARYIWVYVAWA